MMENETDIPKGFELMYPEGYKHNVWAMRKSIYDYRVELIEKILKMNITVVGYLFDKEYLEWSNQKFIDTNFLSFLILKILNGEMDE